MTQQVRAPGPAHGHDESGDHPSRSTFITIWLVLAFLTVLELFVPRVYSSPHNHTLKMLLLVMLASGKAMLVALFFMHLKWEKPWVRWIALMPAYMGFAAGILMIEEHFRPVLSSSRPSAPPPLPAPPAPAAACPYCSIAQGGDTLFYIGIFLVAPYFIVSGTWLVIRHILKSESL